MVRKRLTALRFPNEVVRDVSKLVELHLRFHGYGDQPGTDQAGTDQAGTDQAGTDQAGTDQAGASQAGASQAGAEGLGDTAWTDSAVRRYVRDAGPLLDRLHVLTRADCTTRNVRKAERLARAYDSLEQRIAELREQEELEKIRPDLDGNEIMRILGIKPGRLVGEAYTHLLELRINEGALGPERATAELLHWARAKGILPSDD
jgi:poly(A) polymerase